MNNGSKSWYIVDGYRPPLHQGEAKDYAGHEWYGILNCNKEDAHVLIDIFFTDRPPVLGIPFLVPAQRLGDFYSHQLEEMGGVKLDIGQQYSLRIRSDIGVVLQYGRMDVNQPNLSYLATMGHAD